MLTLTDIAACLANAAIRMNIRGGQYGINQAGIGAAALQNGDSVNAQRACRQVHAGTPFVLDGYQKEMMEPAMLVLRAPSGERAFRLPRPKGSTETPAP